MVEVPDFSKLAAEYAASRPAYPRELFEWVACSITAHDAAWDAATGNGQAALGLARHFTRVIATDLSASEGMIIGVGQCFALTSVGRW